MGEMSLYMYILCGLDLRRLRRRSTQDLHILESFSFILGKPQRITRKGFVIYSRTSKEYNICLAADSESTVNCRKF
jgi:hypothetical protein